jgi:hypothetical protein
MHAPPRLDEFKVLPSLPPLTLREGAPIAPVDFKELEKRMASGDKFELTAGGNASWIAWAWRPTSIPVLSNSVRFLASGRYAKPRALRATILVAEGSDPTRQWDREHSLLKRLSAEEDHTAMILATYRDSGDKDLLKDAR